MSRNNEPLILVVDANVDSLSVARPMLTDLGYEVYTAATESAAIATAARTQMDLVLCDVRVGGSDGIELFQRIRRIPRCAEIPAVFFSSSQRAGVIHRTHDFGPTYHLQKPLNSQIIALIVELVLQPDRSEPRRPTDPHFIPNAPSAPPVFPKIELRQSGFFNHDQGTFF